MRFLIVEDDLVQRKVYSRYAQVWGTADIAENGMVAITLFKRAFLEEHPYEVILLDIGMPGLDGQETLKELRRIETANKRPLGRGAKIIMITALDEPEHVLRAFREHCDSYLVKPVIRADLEQELRRQGLIP
jgi:two-component system chemotaxis response regulator CheY